VTRWSWEDRWLLAQVLFWLPVSAALLRTIGFSASQSLLSMVLPPATGQCPSSVRPERTRDLVRLAAEHGPYRATCLPQSLVLWWLVRRHGGDARLRVGVRRAGTRVEAHAWVECGGTALNDAVDVYERYAMFDQAIA
jgi:hypothetical protein